MDAIHYWPFAREYTIWNATLSALQFCTEDLKPNILNDAIERVTQHSSAANPHSIYETYLKTYYSVTS